MDINALPINKLISAFHEEFLPTRWAELVMEVRSMCNNGSRKIEGKSKEKRSGIKGQIELYCLYLPFSFS
jgi:hypothetical protein